MIKEFLIAIMAIAIFILVLCIACFVIAVKYPDQRPGFPKVEKYMAERSKPVESYTEDYKDDIEKAYMVLQGLTELSEQADSIYKDIKQYNERALND